MYLYLCLYASQQHNTGTQIQTGRTGDSSFCACYVCLFLCTCLFVPDYIWYNKIIVYIVYTAIYTGTWYVGIQINIKDNNINTTTCYNNHQQNSYSINLFSVSFLRQHTQDHRPICVLSHGSSKLYHSKHHMLPPPL